MNVFCIMQYIVLIKTGRAANHKMNGSEEVTVWLHAGTFKRAVLIVLPFVSITIGLNK